MSANVVRSNISEEKPSVDNELEMVYKVHSAQFLPVGLRQINDLYRQSDESSLVMRQRSKREKS